MNGSLALEWRYFSSAWFGNGSKNVQFVQCNLVLRLILKC